MLLKAYHLLRSFPLASPGPPPVNPHITTEPTGRVRSRVKRKSSTPDPFGHNTHAAVSVSGIVNPLSALNPSCLMASLFSPGPSDLINTLSAPGMSESNPLQPRTMAWQHKRDRQKGKISRSRKAYTCTVCARRMTTAGHTQYCGQQRLSGYGRRMKQQEKGSKTGL